MARCLGGGRWVGEVAATGVGGGSTTSGGGARQRKPRRQCGYVVTSERPQGSRVVPLEVEVGSLPFGAIRRWFVRSGFGGRGSKGGVARRLDISRSSAPAAQVFGFTALNDIALASLNSWCLFVSEVQSDCVDRGDEIDGRVDGDHGTICSSSKIEKTHARRFLPPAHVGCFGSSGARWTQ